MSFRPSLLQSPGFCSDDDQEEQSKDYLQDPSLWWDPLPQPFRMIDGLLQEILQNALEKIEKRAKIKKESRKTIKLTEEATLISSIPEPKTLQYLQTGDREYIFGGGGLSGLYCIQFKPVTIQATYDTTGIVSSISSQDMSNEILVTAIGMEEKGGQLVLVLQDLQFKEICEIEGLDIVQTVLLSSRASHLAVTGTNNENNSDVVVKLFGLPTENWAQQLQMDSSEISFAKPTLLFVLPSPSSPLVPCPMSDPMQSLKHVQERPGGKYLPTGSHHILTDIYFQARRRVFISNRKDFVSDNAETQPPITKPSIHFLVNSHTGITSSFALHWEQSMQLLIYNINNRGKFPDRVYTQGSTITSMAINGDSSLMSLGLRSGTISVFNLTTGICWGTVAIGLPGVAVTAVYFARTTPLVIVVGCEDGRINCVRWNDFGKIENKCLNSGFDIKNGIEMLRGNIGLPSTVTSLHTDGQLIIWDWQGGHPLCQLSLPSSFLPSPGSLVTTSDTTLVLANKHQTEQGLFSWSLSSCELLRKTWLETVSHPQVEDTFSNSKNALDYLINLAKNDRHVKHNKHDRIKKRWSEYRQELTV